MFQVSSFIPMVVYTMFYFTLDCSDYECDTHEEVGGAAAEASYIYMSIPFIFAMLF
jgi:hypothetical protein